MKTTYVSFWYMFESYELRFVYLVTGILTITFPSQALWSLMAGVVAVCYAAIYFALGMWEPGKTVVVDRHPSYDPEPSSPFGILLGWISIFAYQIALLVSVQMHEVSPVLSVFLSVLCLYFGVGFTAILRLLEKGCD